jgi:hypothetical protein
VTTALICISVPVFVAMSCIGTVGPFRSGVEKSVYVAPTLSQTTINVPDLIPNGELMSFTQ